ncbi:MAG TPA: hypothetical protein VEZ41_14065 [Allosphingosinicella sp.]|nr:hypothetical protein [Allosphingosinicella sp.]
MEQDRISSRDPGAILPQAHAFPDEADQEPPIPSGMDSIHLPAIVDPLEPAEPDTAFARTRRLRHDGWTPDEMRAFLERFAECGVISEACAAVGISARSAYNLRDRDPLFAAGLDAACVKARPRLADEVLARSMTGVVERIYKDGVIVAERHRHDNRLSMAVLARLDARVDRAEAEGAPHIELAARWDEFLAALGEDRRADVAALLALPETEAEESAKQRELHELQLHELQQEEEAKVAPRTEEKHKAWQDGGRWWTDFPPPPGFEGKQVRRYGGFDYKRHCTPEEAAAMEAREERAAAALEARRAAWFGLASGGGDPGPG